MSAEKDRETISAASTAAPVPAGAVFVSYTSADAVAADPIAAAPRSAQLAPRAVLAVGVGNALEFYDFTTFAYFAIQIRHTFFPPESTHGLL
jgi:hypothetical protein